MTLGNGCVAKRMILLATAVLLVLAASFCGKGPEDGQQKIVATVNDYQVTLDDFHRQLNAELEFTPEVKLTRAVRKHFLEELIRKELMIQEAKRRGLDTEPDFVRAMEKYWESTLIRKLLEIKGKEFEERVLISEADIQAQYQKLRAVDADISPMEEMRGQLVSYLKEEKKTIALQAWLDGLRKRSRVDIVEKLLQDYP